MPKPLFADRQRDRREQLRMQTGLERAMKSKVRAELRRVAKRAADIVADSGDPDLATKGHADRMLSIFQASYRDTIMAFGRRIIDAGTKALPGQIETKDAEGQLERSIQAFIASFAAEKVQQVTDTTKKQIRRVIKNGADAGEDIETIASNIRRSLGGAVSELRSETIARTETHGAAQYGQREAAKSLQVSGMQKGWIDAGDGRERESHAEAAGADPIDLDEKFHVGDSRLEYPGDPSGQAMEIINCRCGTYFEVPD